MARHEATLPSQDWHATFYQECQKVEPFAFAPGDKLYSDGSCLRPNMGCLARAGRGVASIDAQGNLIKGIYGHVPKLFGQSSRVGEQIGVMMAHLHIDSEDN
eukprot:2273953-Pyramimonas_sp.AAC.1